MSFETTWSKDWHTRVEDRVRQRGFSSVTQYAQNRIGVPLLELADELGPDDIAAAQITLLLIEEALRAGDIRNAARDLLVRQLRVALPAGWSNPLNESTRSEVAGAIADWYSDLEDYIDRDNMRAAGRELLAAQLPLGWRPAAPDDAIVATFVDRCMRASSLP